MAHDETTQKSAYPAEPPQPSAPSDRSGSDSSVTCPECNGWGEDVTYQNCWGQWDTKTCHVCQGEGEVPANHPHTLNPKDFQ